MLSLGIIVSHRSTSRGMLPESTRSSLDTAIARLNHAFKGKAKVEIALDYEGFRDLSKNEQTQQSIKKSIIELRDAYDELLFLLLVDGELGEGMKNELAYAKAVNKQLPANKRIMIEALIRQRDDYFEASYPELMDKRNETLPVCTWYSDDRDFKNEAYRIINEILASRLGRPIFPSVLWKILLAILIVLLGWLFYKQCSRENPDWEDPSLIKEDTTSVNVLIETTEDKDEENTPVQDNSSQKMTPQKGVKKGNSQEDVLIVQEANEVAKEKPVIPNVPHDTRASDDTSKDAEDPVTEICILQIGDNIEVVPEHKETIVILSSNGKSGDVMYYGSPFTYNYISPDKIVLDFDDGCRYPTIDELRRIFAVREVIGIYSGIIRSGTPVKGKKEHYALDFTTGETVSVKDNNNEVYNILIRHFAK